MYVYLLNFLLERGFFQFLTQNLSNTITDFLTIFSCRRYTQHTCTDTNIWCFAWTELPTKTVSVCQLNSAIYQGREISLKRLNNNFFTFFEVFKVGLLSCSGHVTIGLLLSFTWLPIKASCGLRRYFRSIRKMWVKTTMHD